MKNVIRMACVGVLALGASVWADTVEADHRVQWLTSVTEGYYNDPANWTDGKVPPHGADNLYGYVNFQNNDVTIKAPVEGLVDSSGSIFLGYGSASHTLTIDTRGTFWEKRGVVAVNNWWGTPFAANLTGTHIFNFEGFSSVANTAFVWRFSDALFTWKSNSSRQDFDLWSGTFSLGKSFFLGASGNNVNFYIHPEAAIYAETYADFNQRGNSTTHTFFLGGRHSLWNLNLKETNANRGKTWLHVTNDTQLAVRNELHVGARCYANEHTGGGVGYIDVSCDAKLSVTGLVCLGSASEAYPDLRNQGELILRDRAVF